MKMQCLKGRLAPIRGALCPPWGRFFKEELCGETLVVMGDDTPPTPGAAHSMKWICSYDAETGLHQLQDGTVVNITERFSQNQVRFGRPLHAIFAKPNSRL